MEETVTTPASWPKRVFLGASIALIAMNVWIGGPLLALWIGARVQGTGSLTIRPLTALTVFGSLALITFALLRLLRVTAEAYDRATLSEPKKRHRDPWLGSAERVQPGDRPPLLLVERVLVVVVVIAALAFEIWFFFFSTSPIDGRTGRSAVPLAETPALRETG